MEEVYLTVKELAELKGCSERWIQLKISRVEILADEVKLEEIGPGRGGIQYRIPLSSLERKIQLKYKRRLKSLRKEIEPAEIEEQPPELLNWEDLSQEEREQIVFWRNLLNAWQSYRFDFSDKETADESFIAVTNAQHPDLKLTRRTLYRKQKDFREGGEKALLDKRGKHAGHAKKLTSEIWDVFEYYFLDQSKKTVQLCMTLTELNFKQEGRMELLPLPSRSTFERQVRSMPIPYIKYFRYSEKEFIGECAPYIKRIYDDLESNDIWVADNHTYDVMVSKDGEPVRVYLTAFMDVRSRKMTGWCVTDAPSSDATIYALKKGCEFHGVPKQLYTDNGREFLFHDLGGNGFRKKRKGEEVKLPSILDDLDIGFQTAIPRNARAKGIERAFDTVKETFSKLFESYTGGTILEKPDKLKQVVKEKDKLVAVKDFAKMVDTYIEGWYNKQPHIGVGMNGKSPDEIFAANLVEKRIIPQEKLNLMFMRYAKGNKGTLKVGKNGVSLKFYGQELQYFTEDLWKLYFGKNVYVRYRPDDLSSVRIFDEEMRFICTAPLKTQLSYQASKENIQAQQQENRSAVKAVKAYKRQKGIEAENELKLILDAATENMENVIPLHPSIIRPIYGTETQALKNAVGDYEEPIDWSVGIERLKRLKQEEE